MQANAEHQQDNADLSKLVGKPDIGDEARCKRTDKHASEEIARDRRHLEAMRESAHEEGYYETCHDRCDQR